MLQKNKQGTIPIINKCRLFILGEVEFSIQKYYYQMSLDSQSQKQQLQNSQQSPLASNSRKKSDSTLEVTENVQQKMNQHNLNENKQQQQDFDEDVYNDLSSGVYQMSRKSQQDQSQQEEKEYFSMEIKMGDEVLQKPPAKKSALQMKEKDEIVGQTYEQVDMDVEQYMQKVLSPKLQSQEVPSHNQQMQFAYPSLMQQSHALTEQNVQQQVSQQIQKQEIQINQNSTQLKIQSNNEEKNTQMNENSQKRSIIQKESSFLPKYEDLLDIKNEEKPKATLILKRRQEEIIQQQNLNEKSKLVALDQGAKLKILGYQKQYFLKIETQVYQIQYSSLQKSYTFNRKFADFVLLQKLIKLKYPGYILYPFPQNSLEFFNKIKLSVGTELQKAILIEKRLLQLEKYLNFLLDHRQLGESQVFLTFISESDQHFARHIAYLQNMFDKQQQKFESSKLKYNYKNIKNLVMSGLSYFKSYVSSKQKNVQNSALLIELKRKSEVLKVNYDEILVELQKNKLVTSNIQIKAEKLAEIYECNIEMKPIESSIDSVLRLSSKMASSKTGYQLNKNWVEDKMLSKIYYFVHIFAQVQQQIQYRKSLLQKIDLLEEEEAKLGLTIIQRIDIFDSRFIQDWNKLKTNFEEQYIEMVEQFSKQWQSHCNQMSKIWK